MTYRELRRQLQNMQELHLDDDVVIFDLNHEKYLQGIKITVVDEDDEDEVPCFSRHTIDAQ